MAKDNKLLWFKIVAWFGAIYHIILGLIGTFAPNNIVISVAEATYRVAITSSSQFFYLAKFLSAYMIAFGFMLALLAYNPKKFRIFIWPAVALFAIRIFDRLVFFKLLNEALGSTMGGNLITVAVAAIMGLLLILLRPAEK